MANGHDGVGKDIAVSHSYPGWALELSSTSVHHLLAGWAEERGKSARLLRPLQTSCRQSGSLRRRGCAGELNIGATKHPAVAPNPPALRITLPLRPPPSNPAPSTPLGLPTPCRDSGRLSQAHDEIPDTPPLCARGVISDAAYEGELITPSVFVAWRTLFASCLPTRPVSLLPVAGRKNCAQSPW